MGRAALAPGIRREGRPGHRCEHRALDVPPRTGEGGARGGDARGRGGRGSAGMTVRDEPAPPGARRIALVAVGLLAVYVLALRALLAPGGGLLGRYFIRGEGGGEILVHERLDPDLNFPVPQRLDAAYIFHWDLRKHGFPATMPPYSIHWSGLLRVPGPGTYGFSADVQGAAGLQIDGSPIDLQPDT